MEAENNWRSPTATTPAAAAGPYHLSQNAGGTGDQVSDDVDFTPWSTTMN